MDRPTPLRPRSRARTCLTGLVGAATASALLAAVLAPAASAQTAPVAPAATPSAGTPAAVLPALAAPALLGPLPSEQVQAVLKDVVLAWRAVRGATGYRVQVSQDGDFSDDDLTLDAKTVATRFALPTDLPNAGYRWRVSATRTTGHGAWSVAGAFTKGWREAPGGLTVSGETEFPTLSWDPLASASEYEVQISTQPTFASDPTQVQSSAGTTACFTARTRVTGHNGQASAKNKGAGDCDFSAMAPFEQRYWRVRALDHVVGGIGQVDTSPVVSDGISYQPPGPKSDTLDTGPCPAPPAATAAPSVSAPASAAPTAAPTVAPSATAAPTTTAAPTAAPTASATPTPTAAPAGGDCTPTNTVQKSAWSEVRPVEWTPAPVSAPTVDTYAPLPLRQLAPEHCTTREPVPGEGRLADCVEFPTLDWDARDGARSYRLYVALDDAFTNIHEIVETPGTEWTPTTAWRDTTSVQSYYYAVQACTAVRCGFVGPTPDSFRKKSPRTELTSPASGTVVGAQDVVLRWRPWSTTLRGVLSARVAGTAATAEAYAYRVQVAAAPDGVREVADADFQRPVEDVVVDGALCRPDGGTAIAPGTAPRTLRRAVRPCSGAGADVLHDAAVDEVVHVSADSDLPTGSYVWRVQALDASGRGTPWSAARSFRRDTSTPTVTVSGLAASVDSPVVVRFSEPVRGAGVGTVTVAPATPVRLSVAADGRSVTIRPVGTWVPGRSYAVLVGEGIADDAGNAVQQTSATARIAKQVDDGSPALRYVSTWTRRTATNAVGGGFRTTTPTLRRQSAALVALHGTGVVVTGCVGPRGGMADVWVDGARRARVDTYRSYSGCGLRLARIVLPLGTHAVQVRGVGVKRPASRGTDVGLDALTAL